MQAPRFMLGFNSMSKLTPRQARGLLEEHCDTLTRQEVARRARVSMPYICMVLKGRKPLTGKLAEFLGLKVHARMSYTYERVERRR